MPASAPTVRFVHSSDWQLGMTREFLSDEAAARFGQARIDAIARLGELAIEHDAGFIIVAGDVFEHNQLAPLTLGRALDALAALPVPVYLLPGNHDPLDASSIYSRPAFTNVANVSVLDDSTPRAVDSLPGVEIVGAPWRSNSPSTDLCAAMLEALPSAQGVLRIGVAHGQIDTLVPDPSRPGVIAQSAAETAIADGRVHYLALGDRHSVTAVGTSGRIWYSGASVATRFTEVNPNHALLVTLAADQCDVLPLRTGNWSFVIHDAQINSAGDVAQLGEWLDALPDKACTIVKIGATGTVSLKTAAVLDALFEDRAPRFASLKRRRRLWRIAVVPDQLDRDSVALSGYAKSAWDALIEAAGDGDAEAQDALRLCYRLSGHGQS